MKSCSVKRKYLYLCHSNEKDKWVNKSFTWYGKEALRGFITSWTECQLQTKGYEGAKYKSFSTHEEAERAFHSSPYAYIGKNAVKTENKHKPSSEVLPAARSRKTVSQWIAAL